MNEDKPNILVTGVSGYLGLRLLPQLKEYRVTGIDLNPPETTEAVNFVRLDLGLEESCRELFLLMREERPVAVIHLASASQAAKPAAGELDRMWQINVGGTARVLEAITEVNRDEEIIKKFIVLSCVFVYGPDLASPAAEDFKLAAHTLPIAIQKMEADKAIQQRAPSVRGCSVFLLRSAMFAGRGASNHSIGAFRGIPSERSVLGSRLAKRNKRVPCIIPWGKKHLYRASQFVHVEDVARVIMFILRKTEPESRRLTVLNVSGRGEPALLADCAKVAGSKLLRVPGEWTVRQTLKVLGRLGISTIPPDATDYLTGEQIMNVDRLHEFLGPYHEDVIRYTIPNAFADSFAQPAHLERKASAGA